MHREINELFTISIQCVVLVSVYVSPVSPIITKKWSKHEIFLCFNSNDMIISYIFVIKKFQFILYKTSIISELALMVNI